MGIRAENPRHQTEGTWEQITVTSNHIVQGKMLMIEFELCSPNEVQLRNVNQLYINFCQKKRLYVMGIRDDENWYTPNSPSSLTMNNYIKRAPSCYSHICSANKHYA